MTTETEMQSAIPIHRGLIEAVMNSLPAWHFGVDALLRLVGIEETTSVATACVSCGEYSTLRINPDFCAAHANTPQKMTMLILHEMHHIVLGHTRLFPRGDSLDNIVFDAVINAMLCHAHPDPASTALFRDFYDENNPILCLLRPASGWSPTGLAVTPPGLRNKPALAALHRKLYKSGCTYHELRDALLQSGLVIEIDLKQLLGGHGAGDDDQQDFESQSLGSIAPALAGAIQSIVDRWPKSEMIPIGAFDSLFNRSTVKVPRTKREELRALIRKVSRSGARADVKKRSRSRLAINSPIPCHDRRGVVLRALGAPPMLHAHQIDYRRKVPDGERVHVYMDVSGSMTEYIPPLYGAIQDCRECVLPIVHLFSTMVADVTLQQLIEGHVITTGGNDISCVVAHMKAHQVRRAVIVTDGYVGHVNNAIESEFMKRVFVGAALTGATTTRDQMDNYVNEWATIAGGAQ